MTAGVLFVCRSRGRKSDPLNINFVVCSGDGLEGIKKIRCEGGQKDTFKGLFCMGKVDSCFMFCAHTCLSSQQFVDSKAFMGAAVQIRRSALIIS